MGEETDEWTCASFFLCLQADSPVALVICYLRKEMVRLIHKLLIQYYFGERNLKSYAISIFLFNFIEAIIELALFNVFTYCGLL